MPRFAANISTLYPEHALLDRIAAAARDGFAAVDVQSPYAVAAEDLARALRAARARDGGPPARQCRTRGVPPRLPAQPRPATGLYRLQIVAGDPIRHLERHFALVAHVQIAGVPGGTSAGLGWLRCV